MVARLTRTQSQNLLCPGTGAARMVLTCSWMVRVGRRGGSPARTGGTISPCTLPALSPTTPASTCVPASTLITGFLAAAPRCWWEVGPQLHPDGPHVTPMSPIPCCPPLSRPVLSASSILLCPPPSPVSPSVPIHHLLSLCTALHHRHPWPSLSITFIPLHPP